MYIFAV